jgi:malonyl-CoA O-methyltransferase
MRGVFVTGTDTNVGKTFVSACLMAAAPAQVGYWKPVQTGLRDGDDDTRQVAWLARLDERRTWRAGPRLDEPASPHHAAALAGVRLALADLLALAPTRGAWVVEGAGGLLVPLNERELMVELIAALGLPVLLVASTRLGTINHTLLSLRELERRRLPCLGVVLSGPPSASVSTALAAHAPGALLAEVPQMTAPTTHDLTAAGQRLWAQPALAAAVELP